MEDSIPTTGNELPIIPEWVQAKNESGGFHGILFNYMRQYVKDTGTVILVSEPPDVIPVLQEYFPGINFGTYDPEIDLNILQKPAKKKVDAVVAQALLEHICRPCVAIETFCNTVKSGGYIILHTHNIQMGYHAFPVDCCRFWKDYFLELCKYLPIKLKEYNEWREHITVCYYRV